VSDENAFPDDARIIVHPFEQRIEGADVTIANASRSSFLSVPPDALELLTLFAHGHPVGEVRTIYQDKYGVTPDLDDFLDTLKGEGFLSLAQSGGEVLSVSIAPEPPARRYHFDNIPVDLARRLVSPVVLAASGGLIAVGLLACAIDPGLLPPPTALVFDHDAVGLFAVLILFSLVTVFAHELAHLVAARAAGVPSRMGVGNRLWILVAETDMTGVWLTSRRQRCLAFLAGPLFDLTSAAVLVLLLFGDRHHWLQLAPALLALTRASLFVVLARLLWQFEFFVPTDLYYVIGALCGCKNLMQDTQTYLVNRLAGFMPRVPRRDQSAIPPREMRVIRWFAIVWLVGRAIAFASLFWITLPVLAGYGLLLARGIGGDAQASQPLFDGPLLPLVALVLQTVGLLAWVRSLSKTRNRTRRTIG